MLNLSEYLTWFKFTISSFSQATPFKKHKEEYSNSQQERVYSQTGLRAQVFIFFLLQALSPYLAVWLASLIGGLLESISLLLAHTHARTCSHITGSATWKGRNKQYVPESTDFTAIWLKYDRKFQRTAVFLKSQNKKICQHPPKKLKMFQSSGICKRTFTAYGTGFLIFPLQVWIFHDGCCLSQLTSQYTG